MKSLKILISGKIYKTGFLYYILQFANNYHIKGFAQYRDTSAIILRAEGSEKDIARFIDYCRIGPAEAKVVGFEITDMKSENFKTFEIIESTSIEESGNLLKK